jgi:hypothetical protein
MDFPHSALKPLILGKMSVTPVATTTFFPTILLCSLSTASKVPSSSLRMFSMREVRKSMLLYRLVMSSFALALNSAGALWSHVITLCMWSAG